MFCPVVLPAMNNKIKNTLAVLILIILCFFIQVKCKNLGSLNPFRIHGDMNKLIRLLSILFISLLLNSTASFGQPVFNVVSAPAWYIPGGNDGPDEVYANLTVSLPVSFGKGNLILFSPFTEIRGFSSTAESRSVSLDGNGVLVNYIRYFGDSAWSLSTGIVLHNYSDGYEFNSATHQTGGIFLLGKQIHEDLMIRFGLYYNREFYGDFFLPLANIDWRPGDRTRVYGFFPRYLVYEYRINDDWYWGARYRGITTSYRLSESEDSYIRYDDRQLTVYIEKYFFERLVIALQAGASVYRRAVSRNVISQSYPDFEDAAPLFKAGVFYRFRTD